MRGTRAPSSLADKHVAIIAVHLGHWFRDKDTAPDLEEFTGWRGDRKQTDHFHRTKLM